MTAQADTSRIARSYPAPDWALRGSAPIAVEQKSVDEILSLMAREKHGAGGASVVNPHSQTIAFFRCVQFLAESVSFMPLCVSTRDDRLVESGPVIDLLHQPNQWMADEDFIQETIGWLFAGGGEAYWVFTLSGDTPVEVLPVGKAQCRPRYANEQKTGMPIGWLYRPSGKRWEEATTLELNQVWPLRIRAFDPDRPMRGLAIQQVARHALDQLYKSDIANKSSLDNGVEPGGVFTMDGMPTEPQIKQTRQQIDERHAGSANRRRPLLLWGGLKWQQTAATYSDMEFVKLRLMSRADVCAAFGLDPSAVGFPPEGGRFEYAEAAEKKAWISRVMPLAKWLAGQIDRGILSRFGDGRSLTFKESVRDARPVTGRRKYFAVRAPQRSRNGLFAWFDGSGVEALSEKRLREAQEVSKLASAMKIPPADLIEAHDLPYPVRDWQKYAYRSSTEIPILEDDYLPGDDDPPAGPQPGSPDDVEASGPIAQLRKLLEATHQVDALPGVQLAESEVTAYWRAWRGLFAGNEAPFQSRYKRHMAGLRDEVLDKVAKYDGLDKPQPDKTSKADFTVEWLDDDGVQQTKTFDITVQQRDFIGEVLFDLVPANKGLRVKVMPLIRASMQAGGDAIMGEAAEAAGADQVDPFNLDSSDAQAVLREREVSITDINRRTQQRLRAALADAMQQGKSADEIADTIRHRFKIEANKARTIAYQELSSSVEEARYEARRQANVPLKSWLWSRKETGRPLHAKTEQYYLENPIPVEEEFTLGGPTGSAIRCKHPRATGHADQDINCGCTVISRYPGDSIKSALATTTRAMTTAALTLNDEPAS